MQPVHPSILPSRLGSLGSIRAPVHPSILPSRLGSLGSIRALLPQRSVLATPHSTYRLGHSPLSVPSWPLLTQHRHTFSGWFQHLCYSPQMQFHRPNTVHFALSCDLRKTKRDLPHKPNQTNHFKCFLYQ